MIPRSSRLWSGIALGALAWAGLVALRYRGTQPPEPIGVYLLLLLWLAILTLACAGAGRPARRLLAAGQLDEAAAALIALAAGALVLIAAAALLGAVGWLRPLPLTVVLVGAAALGLPAGGDLVRTMRRIVAPGRRLRWWVAVIAVVVVLTLAPLPGLSPFYDQLHYHLGFPYQWLRHGRIATWPREVYSFLPADMSLLYAYALATLGPWAAQATHWWMGALAVAGTGLIARAAAGPRASWWAAAILAAAPAVMTVSTWAGADLGAAAFGVAAWLMLLTAKPPGPASRRVGYWLLAGGLAGAAAGCKYLALATVAVPFLLAVAALAPAPGWRGRARAALLGATGLLAALAPWLVRNAALTGNPLYPYLGRLFAQPGAAAEQARLAESLAGLAPPLHELAPALTLTTFAPRGEAGALGPVFLAFAPLAVVALFGPRRRLALGLAIGAVGGAVGWAASPLLGRFLVPALPPLAALEAAGWSRVRAGVARRLRGWLDALLLALVGWGALGGVTANELARISSSLRLSDPNELMRRYASYWPALDFVDHELPAGAKLLMIAESRSLLVDRDVVLEDPFHTPFLVELARQSASEGEMARRLRAMGVTHVLINWRETVRIAALGGREEYFAPLEPVERQRLTAFLKRCLRRLSVTPPVEVYALAPCP